MGIYNEIGRRQIVLSSLDGVTNGGPTLGIWVAAAGNLVVVLADDPLTVETTFTGVPAGTWMPVCARKHVSSPAGSIGIAC